MESLGPGTKLQNRYTILSVLGQGGMGVVYRARHDVLQTEFALKVLRVPEGALRDQAQHLFQKEAQVLARLQHPNLVRVTDCFEEDDHLCLVMDLVEGESLDTRVARSPATVPEVVGWMLQACDALEYLHAQAPPLIHRDLKPGNLMLDTSGRVKIVDFGIARALGSSAATSTLLALTAGYAPVEQYGHGPVGSQADIYALGATCYALLTGVVPPPSVDRMSGESHLIAPSLLNPSVSPRLEEVVLRMMAVGKAERHATVAEVRQALQGVPLDETAPPTRLDPGRRDAVDGDRTIWPRRLGDGAPTTLPADARAATRARSLRPVVHLLFLGTLAVVLWAWVLAPVGPPRASGPASPERTAPSATPSAPLPVGEGRFSPLASHFTERAGYFFPLALKLGAPRPGWLQREPHYEGTPLYGRIPLGTALDHGVAVVLDRPADGASPRLYVDARATGEPDEVTWRVRTDCYTGRKQVRTSRDAAPVELVLYQFTPSFAARRGIASETLFYYRDYGMVGSLNLGGRTLAAMLSDDAVSGRFDRFDHAPGTHASVTLLVDTDGDGRFDTHAEAFDASRPFNIDGTTYEVKRIAADGSRITVERSSQTVAEIPHPPREGQDARPFVHVDLEGREVRFPADYRGKLVLLDFWATWCGPCRDEIPHVVATYGRLHDQGFEVLGVSLDLAGKESTLRAFVADNRMPWPQIYEGAGWSSTIAASYGVHAIPAAFLVDGTSGRIVASGARVRGPALAATVERALRERTAGTR